MRCPYGKSILITGASSGIGLAAAELFARAGYTVFAASRHCEESARGSVINIQMDGPRRGLGAAGEGFH